jgi:superfamily II DNA or RNA helicase
MDQQTMKSLLIVAATGLGKTVIMGGLARSWPKGRVMMISHRYELNTQAIKSFEWICGEDVDLEQAHFRADQRFDKTRIVVASVQTLNSTRRGKSRMERFDPEEFGLLLIDEAHRSAAASYRRVIEYMRQNKNLVVVGVTATPDRLDGVGLGCVYEKVSCNLDMLWGVKNGWLVSPRQVTITLERLDLSQI